MSFDFNNILLKGVTRTTNEDTSGTKLSKSLRFKGSKATVNSMWLSFRKYYRYEVTYKDKKEVDLDSFSLDAIGIKFYNYSLICADLMNYIKDEDEIYEIFYWLYSLWPSYD